MRGASPQTKEGGRGNGTGQTGSRELWLRFSQKDIGRKKKIKHYKHRPEKPTREGKRRNGRGS